MKHFDRETRRRIRVQALGNARWFANRGEPAHVVDAEIRRGFCVPPTDRRRISEIECELAPEDLAILQAQQRRKPPAGKRTYLEHLNL